MRRVIVLLAWVGLALGFACRGAFAAGIEAYFGSWENPRADASGLAYVIVGSSGGNRVHVRLYGDCRPGLCDWGRVPADRIVKSADGKDVIAISALIHYGFAHRRITLRWTGQDTLGFQADIRFVANSGKKDVAVSGGLRRSSWGGPPGNAAWEPNVGRNAGWGGGARGAKLRPPKESCRAFDPRRLKMLRQGQDWLILAGDQTLIRTRHDEESVRLALAELKHSGFDGKCHTGTMEYWKKGQTVPAGSSLSAHCITFSSTTAHVARIGKSWRVIDGTQTIADLNISRDNAYAVLALIRQYRLERKCAVGWPNPALIFWLAAQD